MVICRDTFPEHSRLFWPLELKSLYQERRSPYSALNPLFTKTKVPVATARVRVKVNRLLDVGELSNVVGEGHS